MAIEILSPAGSFESLVAGIRCGANAVYFGGKGFNARRNAGNFDEEEFRKAVEYVHERSAKAHVTLNTLVSDDEFDDALEMIKHVCDCNADVLILQDLGLAQLAKKSAPQVQRHASTQMSVQTAYGINLLEEMGYTRAVLPRETSLEEIKNIKSKTNIELEYFVHGALCMCVSGQCYLSAMLGSRSGNRGLCAQPCRLPFAAENGTGHDLSLKDLSLAENLDELEKAGIASAKIEGRMKRPEYVAAAVTACKNAVGGKRDIDIDFALRAVFSRSGFTKGYYEGKIGRDMFGTRMKEDVVSAKEVFPMLQRLYDRETPLIPVDLYLTVIEGEKVSLSAAALGVNCYAESDCIPEKAVNKPMTEDTLKQRLAKCGGTPFYANEIEIDMDPGLIVSAGVINGLRRQVLEGILEKLKINKPKKFNYQDIEFKEHKAEKMKTYIRLDSIEQLPDDLSSIDTVYLPLNTPVEKIKRVSEKVNVGVEIPRGIFGSADKVYEKLENLVNEGIYIAYCTNLDGVAMARKLGMDMHTGFTLNVYNSMSLETLENLGVLQATASVELTLSKLKKLGGNIPRGIIAYGNIPLMLTKNCPVKNGKTCDKCGRNSYLTDRMGIKFPVICTNGCSEVLNSRPIYLADRMKEIENMDFITLYFTKETKSQVQNVINAYKNQEKPTMEYTRGLYYRGVE